MLVLLASTAASQDTLFEEAFGKKPSTQQATFAVQLELDGDPAGWGTALVSPAGVVQVVATELLEVLSSRLTEEVLSQLKAEAGGKLALSTLEQAGLEARYDASRLTVSIVIPARLRRPVVNTLGGARSLDPLLAPGAVSGVLNVWLAQDFVFGPGGGREPFRATLESAVNVHGWVLEARAELSEPPQPLASLGQVRLVKDDVPHAVRFVAGDFSTPTAGLLRGQSLLGVGAARNFSLDRARQVVPAESVDFLLERPSQVEVFINGRLAQTLQLAAGLHDLRELVLEAGANELELVITDDHGLQRRLTRRVGLASGQLAQGVFEGAVGVGFPLRPGALARSYEWTQPTLSASYRRGLTPALTLGAELELTLEAQAAGVEALWSTFFGAVGVTAALSQHEARAGYAAGLRYELQRRVLGGLPLNVAVGGEYRSADFQHATGAEGFAFSAAGTLALGEGLSARLMAGVRSERARGAATVDGTASLMKSFRAGPSLAFDVTASHNPERELRVRGRLNFIWAFPEGRRSAQALTELDQTGKTKAQLMVNQELSLADVSLRASAGVAQDAAERGTFESLALRTQRFEASVRHRLSAPLGEGQPVTNALQARVGTALVFADGVFAWSRPVTSSFALVAPIASLAGQKVEVNPSTRGYSGANDVLGAAVLQDLEPYAAARLAVNAPALPVGASLGPDAYALRPGYRSGTLIRVGEAGSVFLRGTLLDAAGAPLALKAGTVLPLDGEGKPLPFFTNRTGRFVLAGLVPGRYALTLEASAAPLEFVIPAGQTGLYELGERRVP